MTTCVLTLQPTMLGMCSLPLKKLLKSEALYMSSELEVKDRSASSRSSSFSSSSYPLVGTLKVCFCYLLHRNTAGSIYLLLYAGLSTLCKSTWMIFSGCTGAGIGQQRFCYCSSTNTSGRNDQSQSCSYSTVPSIQSASIS